MTPKIVYALVGPVVLTGFYGLTKDSSIGLLPLFMALFLWLKPVVGFRSWGHAVLGGAIASGLYIATRLAGEGPLGTADRLLTLLALFITAVTAVRLWQWHSTTR